MKRIINNITHPAVHIKLQCDLWLPLTLMDHSKPPSRGFWCHRWLTLLMEYLHCYYRVHQFYTLLRVWKTGDDGHIEWTGQPQWWNFFNHTWKWGTKGPLSKQSFWILDYIINLASHKREVKNARCKCQVLRAWHCCFLYSGPIWSNTHSKKSNFSLQEARGRLDPSLGSTAPVPDKLGGWSKLHWLAFQSSVWNGPNSRNSPYWFSPSDQEDSLKLSLETVTERTWSCCYLFYSHQGFQLQLKPTPGTWLGQGHLQGLGEKPKLTLPPLHRFWLWVPNPSFSLIAGLFPWGQ